MSLNRPHLGCCVAGTALLISAACACLANADAEDYERGMKVLEESRQQREFERRIELLDEAEAAFRTFLKENPEHPSARSARSQIGNILVEQARMQMARAGGTKEESRSKARDLYGQAYQCFDKATADLSKELTKLRYIDFADREKLARRNQLRAAYLQAQLLRAAVLEESADTYDVENAKRQEILAEAGNEYQEVYKKYRTLLAGHYARCYQGRCFNKGGKCDEALQCLHDVLGLPDEPMELTALKTKALNLALECWLDDSQKEYRLAAAFGDEWLKKHGDRNPESPAWLELRFRLARTHWLLAESLEDIQERVKHREKARALAESVRRREGAFRAEAQKLLDEIEDDG